MDDIRARHAPIIHPDEPFVWVATGQRGLRKVADTCSFCDEPWPCDTAITLACSALMSVSPSNPLPQMRQGRHLEHE